MVLTLILKGIQEESYTDEWEFKLFMFNYLISSMFIYNTRDDLKSKDLNRLEIISHLADRLSLRSGASRHENENELRHDAPDFVCILRDLALKQQFTTNEHMKQFLQMEHVDKSNVLTNIYFKTTNALDESIKNNEIRKNMMNLFKQFDCFRLPVPVIDKTIAGLTKQDALLMLDQVRYDDLREKFRTRFDQMCEEIRIKLRPKCLNDTYLNGFKLAEYMKLMVNLINNNQTVCIYDTLVAATMREAHFTLDKCKEIYNIKMNQFKLKLPVSQEELDEKDHSVARECLVKLHKALASNPKVLDDFKNKFYHLRNIKYKEIWRANKSNKMEKANGSLNGFSRDNLSSNDTRRSSEDDSSSYSTEYKDFDE